MTRRRAAGSPLAWLGTLLALYLSVPIFAFIVRLAVSDDRGFDQPGLFDALWTSVLSASISTAIIAVFGIPLAHWLARSHSIWARIAGVVVQLPLALPPVMSGIILIYIVGPLTPLGEFFGQALTGSLIGIVIAQTFVASPFLIVSARTAFAGVDPALEDLAATLGHRSLARFWRVALPVAAPSIRAGMLLTWLRALGEYGATVLLAYNPFSLPVYTYVQFSGSGLPTTQAPTALALGVAILAVLASLIRYPRALRGTAHLPAPRHPARLSPVAVGFDIDTRVGTFHLKLAHRAASNRVAILGPSGSGKSILLRALAGLLGPGAGEVYYSGRPVASIPVERRGIGYVPQGRGLLPGKTVWQQLNFAVDADPATAAWWLNTLHLTGLQDRLPGQLSGGQRQRASVAQALSHRPRLVLLDEPFSALDAPVRSELRSELRRLQQQTSLSTVLVTHDPEEAALLADEVLVIADGRLLQAGPREEVFRRPASPRVAQLLGIHNLNRGRAGAPESLTCGGMTIACPTHRLAPGTEVLWSIRPDHIAVSERGEHPARVTDIADIGTLTVVDMVLPGGIELRARTTAPPQLRVGDACAIDLQSQAIMVWPAPVPEQTEEPSPLPLPPAPSLDPERPPR